MSPEYNHYARLFDAAPLCVAVVGADDEVLYASPCLRNLLGIPSTDLHANALCSSHAIELPAAGEQSSHALSTGDGSDTMVEISCWWLTGSAKSDRRVVLFQPLLNGSSHATPPDLQLLAGNMAHQLRNPIAAIGGALQVLRDRGGWPASESEIVNQILRRLAELNRGVDCLLDFARNFEPVLRPVDLLQIAEGAAMRMATSSEVPAAEVNLLLRGAPVEVLGDAELLERALFQLYRNAAEAAPGSRFDVEVSASGKRAVIEVVDVGPGCHPELRPRMFEPFFTTKSRHFGIGLPVASRIAEAHSGTVDCVATGAEGTHMRLTVPRSGDNNGSPGSAKQSV